MTDRLTELKNITEQSSQLIGYQLQSIDSSLLGAFVSVIISAFISKTFGLLIYWIPASFFLMWVILLFSLFKSYIPLMRKRPRNEDTNKTQTVGLLSVRNMFLITTRFKNAAPHFKAIGIIFLVSFISLVMYKIGVIKEDATFPIIVPIISSLLFMSLPILNHMAIGKLEKMEGELDFTKIGCLALFIIVVYAFAYIFALLVLPIWSLVIMHPIYIYEPITLLAILVVIFLQVITALTFINYFSASSVRKELTIALFNLSKVLNRINDLLNQTISDEIYHELKEDYLKAKRYEMSADDTLLVGLPPENRTT